MAILINGDDFGMTESCSLAIAQALAEGLIQRTSMAANGAYFDEAAALAHAERFTNRIGVHFNLTEGRPLTLPIRSSELFVRGGCFHKEYLRHPRALSDTEKQAVYTELAAQIERLRGAGIPISHADSHHYLHTYAPIAPLFAEICKVYGVRTVRINRNFSTPERPMLTECRIDNAYWQEQGFETTAHFGRLSDLPLVPNEGDTELLVHPDFDRSRALIDRQGVIDGYPVGDPLKPIP